MGVYDAGSWVVRRAMRRIEGPPILDADTHFPNAARFTDAWQAIRDEALAVRFEDTPRFHDIMPEQADISDNDGRDWRFFILKAYDVEVRDNLARMPIMGKILADCPEVISASISILAPRKHIPRHTGPFKGIMRFTLGLSVPQLPDGRPAAVMYIDDQERRLGDGESLLWDDTYPHEVFNHSDEPRAALTLDVWRPNMPWDMEVLSRVIATGVGMGMRWRGVTTAARAN